MSYHTVITVSDSDSESAVSKVGKDASKQAIEDSAESSAEDNDYLDVVAIKARITRSWRSVYSGGVTFVSQAEYERLMLFSPMLATKKEEEKPKHAVTLDTHASRTTITLLSPWLVDAYKKVYDRPILSKTELERSTVEEIHPFPSLLFYLNKIGKEIAGLGNEAKEATRDFDALKFVLREATEEDALSEDNASDVDILDPMGDSIYYDQIWHIFIPGSLVVCHDKLGSRSVLMLAKVKIKASYTNLHTWQLGWDNLHQNFKRYLLKFRIGRFHEKEKINSLVVYPIEALPEKERDELLSKLRERGRKWARLVSGPPSCFFYKHLSSFTDTENPLAAIKENSSTDVVETIQSRSEMETLMHFKIAERVIIDKSYFDTSTAVLPVEYTLTPIKSDLDCRQEYEWDDLPPIYKFTDEQAQLCPASIHCASIASEKVHLVSVEHLSSIDWTKQALDALVLPPHQKSMLRSLVQQQTGGEARKGGDLIKAKGQGLVILLHGPPGVGKTLTAESIAEYVERPLLPLSISKLVTEEGDVERRLLAVFRKATRWNAILLLDEADVILEERSFEDVKRNGIVSMMLRNLEYFNGVLFLTTNRISTMDNAFESRIQIAIHYKSFNGSTRETVWRNLIRSKFASYEEDLAARFIDDTRKVDIRARMSEAKAEILANVDVLANQDLNGRQIRNSLNIAEGLAFADSQETGQIRLRHITQSIHMALEFQEFFKTARAKAQLDSTSVWAPYGDVDSN
ncbi:hypothetical protein BTUL_0494g00020 [Botrytis tulipae]|uniref:AAA+ ATPase domain-containing protein n=1 Tax=Botrytis tulipae TaxID=87230 RepID=A0A4Z1E7Y7_9HELO|nr:hypothetical protein BTUL_0494g00020 [Botrytis tulipae]